MPLYPNPMAIDYHDEIRQFQKLHDLPATGEVGPRTWAKLTLERVAAGADQVIPASTGLPTSYPARPPFDPLTTAQATAMFGDPTGGHHDSPDFAPDGTFKPDLAWVKASIVGISSVAFPGSGQVAHFPKTLECHRMMEQPLIDCWRACYRAGLIQRLVKTFNGTLAFRKTRGGDHLSMHAFGVAIDLNADWNKFGETPAGWGDEGAVREMVAVWHAFGFYWGGHFSKQDGQHFQLTSVKV